MNKMIILSRKEKKKLEHDFSVTRQAVWMALNYKTQGGKSNVLRAAALQRGGFLIVPDDKSTGDVKFIPTIEEVPHRMVQSFSDRVKLVYNFEGKDNVVILVDNQEVESYENVLMSKLPELQVRAQAIVNGLK